VPSSFQVLIAKIKVIRFAFFHKAALTTHVVFLKAFTVVSLARELTKLTISARMDGSRKCEAISAVHCWMEGQPVIRETEREKKRERHFSSLNTQPLIVRWCGSQCGRKYETQIALTKFSHESDPRLAGELVDGVQSARASLLQLRDLPPTQPQPQILHQGGFYRCGTPHGLESWLVARNDRRWYFGLSQINFRMLLTADPCVLLQLSDLLYEGHLLLFLLRRMFPPHPSCSVFGLHHTCLFSC